MSTSAVPDSAGKGKSTKVDFANPLSSRRYRLKAPRHWGVKWIYKMADWVESFIASRSLHPDVAVYETEIFQWTKCIEGHWRGIREELDGLMARREAMPSFHEILTKAKTISKDAGWKTFFLMAPGLDCSTNQKQCPQTTKALREIPDIQTAFFSILSPHKRIPPHRGPFNGVLRYHLGLIVPKPRKACGIRIGTQICHWEEGKSLIFDDTYNHEVWNDTESYRVVLFVDFARPMRSPHDWWVKALLRLAGKTPWLKEADVKQKDWEKRFYQKQNQQQDPMDRI